MAASSKSLVLHILAASVSASNRAACIVRDIIRKGDLGIVEKGKNDFQTEADRLAQKCIVTSLNRHFPKVPIYAEEDLEPRESIPNHLIEKEFCTEVLAQACPTGFVDIKDEEVVIWVDPVDGTTEYTQGFLDHVTILIGVAVRGMATGGVINQPFYNYNTAGPHTQPGRCVWGLVGLGGFGFRRGKPPVGQNIISTSRKHTNEVITEAVEACQPTKILRVGGAGHKMLMLMEGKAHAYIYANPGSQKWDTCAPDALLHAVGGRVSDLLGQPLSYHRGVQSSNFTGVLATAPGVDHDWYIRHLPQHIKEKFRNREPPSSNPPNHQSTL